MVAMSGLMETYRIIPLGRAYRAKRRLFRT
jgi:hypothetical protein